MTTKHTPGPWIHRHSYVCTPGGNIVALIEQKSKETDGPNERTGSIDYMERDCNAELIAAAPELLEACKGAMKLLDALEGLEMEYKAALEVRAHLLPIKLAIARAEGQQ